MRPCRILRASTLNDRANASGSYDEALFSIGEYVNFNEPNEPGQSENDAEQFGMKLE